MTRGIISASLVGIALLLLTPFFLERVQTFFLNRTSNNNSRITSQSETIMTDNSSFSLQIISDIHVEFPRVRETLPAEALNTHAPYLALLGDIGYPGTDKYRDLLLDVAGKFKKVFVLAGNHEFYKVPYYKGKQFIQEVCNERDNLIFMDKTSLLVDGVRILGTTLWSDIIPEHANSISRSINDYHMIYVEEAPGSTKMKKLTTDQSQQWFNEEKQWLQEQIAEARKNGEKVLVLTHHAPSRRGTSAPEFDGSENNSAFASDLEVMMGDPIKVWCFGHTHFSSDQVINGTRVVSNQVGYIMFNEKSGWTPGKVITI